jgi:hypothetical protein
MVMLAVAWLASVTVAEFMVMPGSKDDTEEPFMVCPWAPRQMWGGGRLSMEWETRHRIERRLDGYYLPFSRRVHPRMVSFPARNSFKAASEEDTGIEPVDIG